MTLDEIISTIPIKPYHQEESGVEKGDGHFEKTKDGWRVQHAECCLKTQEIDMKNGD